MEEKFTRGFGLLENFLSKLRAKKADFLIPENKREGIILDIGCGHFPYFLKKTKFKKKVGIDKIRLNKNAGIHLIQTDIEKIEYLPFKENIVDVVTCLAVFEHIERKKLFNLLREIKRILKKEGILILTTPNFWTENILKILARLNILSYEEIIEHKKLFKKKELLRFLTKAGFEIKKIESGYFELGCNIWVKVVK